MSEPHWCANTGAALTTQPVEEVTMAAVTISQPKTCSVCSLVHYSHGVCRKHYRIMKVTGEISVRPYAAGKTLIEKIKLKSEVNPVSGCWEWSKGKNGTGYAQIRHDGKARLAHRVSYMEAYGAIPDDLHLCHRCDNRACVNPEHLFVGDDKANSDDKLSKGRQARGESHGMRKLGIPEIYLIRAAHGTNEAIGLLYGITAGAVSMIKHRKRWAHV